MPNETQDASVSPAEALAALPDAIRALEFFRYSVGSSKEKLDPHEGRMTLGQAIEPYPYGNSLGAALFPPSAQDNFLKPRWNYSRTCEALGRFGGLLEMMDPAIFGQLQGAWKEALETTVCSWETPPYETLPGTQRMIPCGVTIATHLPIPRGHVAAIEMEAEEVLRIAFRWMLPKVNEQEVNVKRGRGRPRTNDDVRKFAQGLRACTPDLSPEDIIERWRALRPNHPIFRAERPSEALRKALELPKLAQP